MKLNIGCEQCLLPGWNHYDIVSVHPDVLQLDVRDGLPFPNCSVDEIYGGHFFDHLDYIQGLNFLSECRRVLMPGGTASFSVMNTDVIINKYLGRSMYEYASVQPPMYKEMGNSAQFACFLLGNLSGQKDYTGHRMLYTLDSIVEAGMRTGFEKVLGVKPDFDEEPWKAEKPEYYDHTLYVVMRKGMV